MRLFATFLGIIVVLCYLGILAGAAEFHVIQDGTGDFAVIQEAIDATIDGDVVIVHPGTYYENIHFQGKNIILRSTDPEDWVVVEATIIDGQESGAVVTFAGTENDACLLSGFTITNGKNGYGGGICGARKWNAPHTKATIEHCLITENTATDAVGACGGGLMWCDSKISDCTIKDNEAGSSGGGLAECFDASLEDCLIIGNDAWSGGALFRFRGRSEIAQSLKTALPAPGEASLNVELKSRAATSSVTPRSTAAGAAYMSAAAVSPIARSATTLLVVTAQAESRAGRAAL